MVKGRHVEKYSVLMSLYIKEKAEFFRMAVDSMMNQTVKPDEIVLVIDGPLCNDLWDVVNEYCESFPDMFNIVKINENNGLGNALNIGLKYCKNSIVARMDSDDYSRKDRCERQLEKFRDNPELDIVGSYVDEFRGNIENVISTRVVPTETSSIYEFSKRRSAFNHPSVMYKKESVLRVGSYRALRRNQDLDLFGRMMFDGCFAENINESLVLYRCSDNMFRRRKSWENVSSYIKIIFDFWKMGYSSLGDYLFVLISQISVFVLPISFQRWLFRTFVRKTG